MVPSHSPSNVGDVIVSNEQQCAGAMLRRLFLLIAFAVPGICTVLGLLPGSRRKSEAVSSVKLKDGRRLAYELRGRTNAKHVAFWNHGIISSRLTAML